MPLGGIRTRNPSERAAVEPCLTPRSHWDRVFRQYGQLVTSHKAAIIIDINGHTSAHLTTTVDSASRKYHPAFRHWLRNKEGGQRAGSRLLCSELNLSRLLHSLTIFFCQERGELGDSWRGLKSNGRDRSPILPLSASRVLLSRSKVKKKFSDN